jgi:hypothetical protein
MTQLAFPTSGHLERKFNEFNNKHPEVYQALSRFANQWRNRKGPDARLGIKMVMERVRWELALGSNGKEPRLNNNHAAFYARLLMDQEPRLRGLFAMRQQRVQASIGPDNSYLEPNEHVV